MANNIEIKARLNDPDRAHARAERLSGGGATLIEQEDVFFPTPRGRLKLRLFSDGTGELIAYQRPDLPGPKQSEYHIHPTADPQSLLRVLEYSLGARGVVRKQRSLYLVGTTRIHIDEVKGLLEEFGDGLIRSRTALEGRSAHADAAAKEAVLFRAGRDLFVYCDGKTLVAYAADRDGALAEVRRLAARHVPKRTPRGEASFKVLEVFARSIETHDVPIPLSARHSRAGLALHYGNEFLNWERWFAGMLRRGRNTISILQGEPGTGKTSFLRHLIVRMRRTHRIYVLPPSEVSYLLRASALGFWLAECKRAGQRPPILIIEDGEKALVRRGPDNHQDVSNILNVADGLQFACPRRLSRCLHLVVLDPSSPPSLPSPYESAHSGRFQQASARADREAISCQSSRCIRRASRANREVYGETGRVISLVSRGG